MTRLMTESTKRTEINHYNLDDSDKENSFEKSEDTEKQHNNVYVRFNGT